MAGRRMCIAERLRAKLEQRSCAQTALENLNLSPTSSTETLNSVVESKSGVNDSNWRVTVEKYNGRHHVSSPVTIPTNDYASSSSGFFSESSQSTPEKFVKDCRNKNRSRKHIPKRFEWPDQVYLTRNLSDPGSYTPLSKFGGTEALSPPCSDPELYISTNNRARRKKGKNRTRYFSEDCPIQFIDAELNPIPIPSELLGKKPRNQSSSCSESSTSSCDSSVQSCASLSENRHLFETRYKNTMVLRHFDSSIKPTSRTHYAAPKFCQSPSADKVPLPPSEWFSEASAPSDTVSVKESPISIGKNLRQTQNDPNVSLQTIWQSSEEQKHCLAELIKGSKHASLLSQKDACGRYVVTDTATHFLKQILKIST